MRPGDVPVPFESFQVAAEPGGGLSARRFRAAGSRLATLVLAHGAGAGQASHFMVELATGLASRGLDVVTFDFPYMRAGRRVPDRNSVLEACWRAMVGAVAEETPQSASRLFIGGKSMGGRIASQVAAGPESLPAPIAGLVFLGYPLHPPGKPAERRDTHLPRIDRPMLFVQGERDRFGAAAELGALVARLKAADLHVVEGGNHSLEPAKRGGTPRDEVFSEVQDRIAEWIAARCPVPPTT